MSDATQCIHCHICQKNCVFLSKYGIDIGDTDKLENLAYHCFLCGRCTEVCPVNIDGRAEVMRLRREKVEAGDSSQLKKCSSLINEKAKYKFRNYRHVTERSVFFPGCNFPSMYPKTTDKLSKLMQEHGIGTVYDCCGKPIAELGLVEDETRIITELNERLAQYNIKEIITVCPNCKGFLKDKTDVRITGVYNKLVQFGYDADITGDIQLYVPCPDRHNHEWVDEISEFVQGEIRIIDSPQCCGLGGSAAVNEPELAKGFSEELKKLTGVAKTDDSAETYLYCASCAGNFKRNGVNGAKHILPELIGTGEAPDTRKSYVNRMLTRLK